MRLNTPAARARPITHEGAPGPWILAEDQLRRSVMTCMLWEKAFYEDGEEISERIARLAKEVDPRTVANLAIEARTTHHLRHVPLLPLLGAGRDGRWNERGLIHAAGGDPASG